MPPLAGNSKTTQPPRDRACSGRRVDTPNVASSPAAYWSLPTRKVPMSSSRATVASTRSRPQPPAGQVAADPVAQRRQPVGHLQHVVELRLVPLCAATRGW